MALREVAETWYRRACQIEHQAQISLLVTFILSAGIVTGLTLPEAVEEEQGQCGRPNAVCFLNNPGTCCSGNCCCGFDSGSESSCSFTSCSPAQEAGTQPGVSVYT
ncbi:hypothetical protein B0H17DRAFT_1150630 [Mycena rosella]|uniref:Uncharacterized protein n=1 Tax=Mycena rosella TaxID=1033263 RepID=A0AAD7FNR1_MYCRO|nr:hypothetical protein B0H17DRAFT_1150630 [Mycena rosella]